jgi:hypothetical protein
MWRLFFALPLCLGFSPLCHDDVNLLWQGCKAS